jgi:hypothetical protein
MHPEKPKQFVDYVCKMFQQALDKRERLNAYKARKLSRLDPHL